MIRLHELDSLRGLACIFVVLFHYTTRYSDIFNTDITTSFLNIKYGGMGVNLFFIISGFVIFLTANRIENPYKFIYKRFIRLYPTFWICVFFTYVITSLSHLNIYHRTFYELLINTTMVPDVFGVRRIDGVYWSLIPEVSFYLMIFLLLMTKVKRHINLVCFMWLLFISVNAYFDLLSTPFKVLFNLKYGHLFIIGINFYLIKFNNSKKYLNHILISLSFILQYFLFDYSLDKNLIILSFILVFYLFIYGKLKWIIFKPLIFFGEISYALYLIHQYVGYIIINKLISLNILNSFLLIIIPFIFVTFSAYIITNYLEVFFRKKFLNFQS